MFKTHKLSSEFLEVTLDRKQGFLSGDNQLNLFIILTDYFYEKQRVDNKMRIKSQPTAKSLSSGQYTITWRTLITEMYCERSVIQESHPL